MKQKKSTRTQTARRVTKARRLSPKAKQAQIKKYSPKTRRKKAGKSIVARKVPGPVGRFFRKPITKISLGLAVIGVPAAFILLNTAVPSLESIQESVVQVEACNYMNYDCGSGSGFAAFRDNLIVTNYHVIAGADEIKIKTIAGVEGKVTNVMVFDPVNDLAIVEWDRKLSPIKLGSSEAAKVGDKVLAIGNPLSETNVVSEGIISSKTSEKGLMTTAAISPGSSGGALILDSDHKVIGVTYMKLTNGESMNYAVKVEDVVKIYNAHGRGEAFSISQNNLGACQTTLAKIALDAANLQFKGCNDAKSDTYTASSVEVFSKTTNDRLRFEYALNERSDWKVLYDRLTSAQKNLVIEKLDNSKSVAFNTNWKYIIWAANEAFYYECQTDYCRTYRYVYNYYPTTNKVSNPTSDDFEKM